MSFKKNIIKGADFKCYPTFRASCCSLKSTNPPTSGITPTFGSLYGSNEFRAAIPDVNIEFDFSGSVSNTVADPLTNSITVLTTGIYEISAGLNSLALENGIGRYEIRRNGIPILGSEFTLAFSNGTFSIGKTIQTPLNAGDIVSVAPISVIATVDYANAALTVNLIGQ